MAEVRERIRELRKARGLTQAELGERVDLTRLTVQNIERGIRKVTAEEALALAHAMGVSVGTLLGEPEPQEPVDLRFEVSVRLLPSPLVGFLEGTTVGDLLRAAETKAKPRAGRTPVRVAERKGSK